VLTFERLLFEPFYQPCDGVSQDESVARVAVVDCVGVVPDIDAPITPETAVTTEVIVGMTKDIR
jgi:hypothetical protein